ncbi:MAG: GNAT family N-acetyltransferase [Burkholderiaceae bacterium]
MLDIQTVSPANVSLVVPLVQEYWAFEAIDGFDAGQIVAQLSRLSADEQRGAAWVAMDDGKAVGYVIVVYVFSLEHLGLTAEVDELYLRAGDRNRGIGQALMQAVEAAAVRAGCSNLSLQVSRTNENARRFYRRAGFVDRPQYQLLEKTLHSRPSTPEKGNRQP